MKKTVIIHPLLFAVFPTLFLYSHNMVSFPLRVIVVPLLVLIVLALAGWAMLSLPLKDKPRAALLVSWVLLLFFSYGHICDATWHFFTIRPFTLGTDKVLFPVFTLLLIGGAFWIIRTRRPLAFWTRFANITSAILVAVPLITIASHYLSASAARSIGAGPGPTRGVRPDSVRFASYPDIYYIILDGYARADILQQLYGYNNSPMLRHLAKRGFYIAPQAHANYCQTGLSLASSLNMRYLDPAIDHLDADSRKPTPIKRMISRSRVSEFVRQHGYRTVAFSTGYHLTEIKSADVFVKTETIVWFLGEFQSGLLNTTPLPSIIRRLERLPFFPTVSLQFRSDAHRQRILRTLHHLATMPQRSAPQFVFAHLILPHPPFVFDHNGACENADNILRLADGSDLVGRGIATSEEYARRYAEQLSYANRIVLATLDSILAKSARAPVIVLQADHGPGSQLDWKSVDNTNLHERLSILNAYYLPEGGSAYLYDDITPVNTFRIVFNHYFGARFELLEDRSYFSILRRPYEFIDVTKLLQRSRADAAKAEKGP